MAARDEATPPRPPKPPGRDRRQIVPLPHDGDRHACRLQAEELGNRTARSTHEALGLDVDERDGPPQEQPPTVLGAASAVEEDPLELDETRVDDECLLLLECQPRLG